MGFFDTTATDLLAILTADGEALTYVSRANYAGATTALTTVMHRNGEDGTAVVNIQTASVASPLFADKITDGSAVVWYISEAQESSQGRTFCELKQSTHWDTIDIEASTNGTWAAISGGSSLLALINPEQSYEEFDDFNAVTKEFTVKMKYLSTVTQKMRVKFGSRYLYITGVRPDRTESRYLELDCREDEA